MEKLNEQTPQSFIDRERDMLASVEGELNDEGLRKTAIFDLTSGLVEARKNDA